MIEKLATLITAAFGLIAALAWNGEIQSVFKKFFGTSDQIMPMVIYALVVTFIAVILTVWIGRVLDKTK